MPASGLPLEEGGELSDSIGAEEGCEEPAFEVEFRVVKVLDLL